jgi:hypothetical protein
MFRPLSRVLRETYVILELVEEGGLAEKGYISSARQVE